MPKKQNTKVHGAGIVDYKHVKRVHNIRFTLNMDLAGPVIWSFFLSFSNSGAYIISQSRFQALSMSTHVKYKKHI